jgi:uncharacterized protein (TIGR02996 family)
MSSLAGFLDAIRADPEDEAARLIFADWLEEQGDPDLSAHAELLRVQCELARWVPDLERRTALQERERELLDTHAAAWLAPWQKRRLHWRYQRGLCRLTLTPGQLRGDADKLRTALDQSFVEVVRLKLSPRQLLSLVGHPRFVAFVALDLSGNDLTDADLLVFRHSPHAGNLRRLDLSNNRLGEAAVAALLDSPLRQQLTWLGLRNNPLPSRAVSRLHQPEALPRLAHLDLHGLDYADEVLAAYAAARTRPDGSRLVNSIGMELVRIPAGTFLMGSPRDEAGRNTDEWLRRPVTLTRPFYLGAYAVTQRQFETVMGDNPSDFGPGRGGGPNHPVEGVSWHRAVEFCRRLSALPAEKAAGRVYRLPTEAEWEHACRAGTTTPFHCGHTLSPADATFDGNYPYEKSPRGNFLNRTTPVGCYEPNGFGLYDMHGNVWEWCADWYDEHESDRTKPLTDPAGPPSGTRKVLRGGSWFHGGSPSRSAYRYANSPGQQTRWNGFRVACDVAR